MAFVRQLEGVRDNDGVGEFRRTTRWVVSGYTRAQLYAATVASDASPEPINTLDTVYLAKRLLQTQVPAYQGAAPLVSIDSEETDAGVGASTTLGGDGADVVFTCEYAIGSSAPPPRDQTTTDAAGVNPARPSIRVATQMVNRQVPVGDIRVYEKTGTTKPAAPKGILPDGSGGFRGADVPVPVVSWSEPHVLAADEFSLAKAKAVVGKMNKAAFRGFPPGSVMCLGVTADQRPEGPWDAVAEFQHSDNLDGPAPGFDDFEDVVKKGWEFLFPLTDPDGEVIALAVAPVSEEADWSQEIPSLG